MKKLPFKIALLLTVFFTSFNAFAQDFQGKAYYQSKTTMDMEGIGGPDASPERKKQIAERMKSFLEKEYVLTFNQAESIYKEDEKLAAPGGGRGFGGFGSSFTGGPKYKNVKTKEAITDQEFFGKKFLIVDDLKNLEWKMGTETKQIGQYTCFKATATTTSDAFDFSAFRRPSRGSNEREEGKKEKDSTNSKKKEKDKPEAKEPKIIEVVAWYSPQIPVNQGPDGYWGLPGLILEVNADRTTILCTKIVLNPEEKEEIEKPKKGDEVTQTEYNEIVTKKMKELRELRGGRGGRGGGRRRN
ncbi:GLPGLI family protein [uncultured Winogradskyella sp.]|uniref:GLPGLI family protein n=1 Tax=uncultured Winogradskyella sp. TaxID=395353 RepID=UPI0026197C2F|nr:GLPGLI family protein [uncultured Winogradskyella sp.]